MGSLRRRLLDDEGVTLVEMMVAILILGIALTALSASLVTSLTSASRQEAGIQANAVANGFVEELRGLDFRAVALCTGEATAVFGGPVTFEGDPLVLLPDTDPRCTGPAADRPVPTESVVQDGRTYDVQVAIAWIDDDGDGLGAADPDTTQDYKRIVVDLTWEDRGNTYTSRTETRRAPEAVEQPMAVQVEPLVTRLRDEGDEASAVTGRNDAAFTFRAVHVLEQSSVTVTWQNRIGDTKTLALGDDDGGFTWSNSVPYNNSTYGLFPNGETLFTFTATDPSGTVTEVVTRKLFLHDLEYRGVASNGITLRSSGSDDASTSELHVDSFGTACDLDISAAMRGMLLSDTVEVGFSSHDPLNRFALSGVAQTVNGADYAIDLSGTAGFPVAVPPDVSTDITATLYADRVVDPPTGAPIEYSWTITVIPLTTCP